ncbi:spaetzle-processing enzyme-like [Drosophila eugracilis]|uniref:spaetzle-processing enzyme-like n=1 Tax=Drosophila eugracilis TaxID=29029 RepID=UPI001BDB1B05|nr:spaetzle-processing enzyme-like [Drosophila eugracilis]
MRKSLINKRQYTCCPKPGNGHVLPTNKICGQKPPGYRIAGGNESAPNEFPWMALLLYKIRLSPRQELVPKCAGSLITTRYILTAAHCIDNATYSDFDLRSVRLGEHDLSTKIDCVTLRNGKQLCSPPHVDIEVEKVILHEAYKNTTSYENDIGLVRVISPVTYTDVIKPICILENHISLANSILQIAGWGRKENQEKTEVLLRAYIKEERYYCWGKPDFLPQTEICAGGQNGEDTCVGDSGGPLMATIGRGEEEVVYAAGITSHGYENYKCGEVPAIYTKTGVFYKWIKQHLRP